MNRKPIFDTVRAMLGRGFAQSEIAALDLACDLAEDSFVGKQDAHRFGSLSETYESSGRGPGTVSGGHNDVGGVSYGVYQLASKAGTCAAFIAAEGMPWRDRFGGHAPGSAPFSAAWKAIAAEDTQGFRHAQHAFIERTHYRPAVRAVLERTGLDLDARGPAVRDATWSCAVQHGGAAKILSDAVGRTDSRADRGDMSYDRELIEAIYDRRIEYVLRVARNPKLSAGTRRQLVSITAIRYPEERAKAIAMLDRMTPAIGGGLEIKSFAVAEPTASLVV